MRKMNALNDFTERRGGIAVLAPDRCTVYWQPAVDTRHPSAAALAEWCLNPAPGNDGDDEYRTVGTRSA